MAHARTRPKPHPDRVSPASPPASDALTQAATNPRSIQATANQHEISGRTLDTFIRRVDHAADFLGERQERDHVLPGVQPGLGDDREPLTPLLVEALELGLGGVGVDGGVDRLEVPRHLLALATRHVFQ
jgi:hypothetical protein